MLKEHFRCVGPIIEYSKREFYNHELRPLRMPKASERLDPPLIDIVVEDGYRKGDVNRPEARFIVDEIKAIVADPNMGGRSIGVVSLLGDKQALLIWERLTDELGPEAHAAPSHRLWRCPHVSGQRARHHVSLDGVGAQRGWRAAFSRYFRAAFQRGGFARERPNVPGALGGTGALSEADRLRRSLIGHFATPFAQDEARVEDLRKLCESPFEREMYDELTQRGYWVTPQVRVGAVPHRHGGRGTQRRSAGGRMRRRQVSRRGQVGRRHAAPTRLGARRLGVLAVFRFRFHSPAEGTC